MAFYVPSNSVLGVPVSLLPHNTCYFLFVFFSWPEVMLMNFSFALISSVHKSIIRCALCRSFLLFGGSSVFLLVYKSYFSKRVYYRRNGHFLCSWRPVPLDAPKTFMITSLVGILPGHFNIFTSIIFCLSKKFSKVISFCVCLSYLVFVHTCILPQWTCRRCSSSLVFTGQS